LVGLTTSPLVLTKTGLVLAPKNDARKLTLFVLVNAGRVKPILVRASAAENAAPINPTAVVTSSPCTLRVPPDVGATKPLAESGNEATNKLETPTTDVARLVEIPKALNAAWALVAVNREFPMVVAPKLVLVVAATEDDPKLMPDDPIITIFVLVPNVACAASNSSKTDKSSKIDSPFVAVIESN